MACDDLSANVSTSKPDGGIGRVGLPSASLGGSKPGATLASFAHAAGALGAVAHAASAQICRTFSFPAAAPAQDSMITFAGDPIVTFAGDLIVVM